MSYSTGAALGYASPTDVQVERQGSIKRLNLEARESLIYTRDRLNSLLCRLRGSLPADAKGEISPPDPDHLVFLANANVSLAGHIGALLGELEECV